MGLIHADILLENVRRPDLQPIKVRAMADTGAILTCIPESVAMQLELEEFDKRSTTFADGSTKMIPYVGPLRIVFKNRQAIGGALMMGDEVLLGSVQMEDMDVMLFPRERKLDVNPSSPNFPHMIVK